MASNPYVNKVIYGSTAVMDISDTTATASDVASGKYIYLATGQKVNGSMTFSTIRVGSDPPSSSLGVNGDIYIQTLA